MFSRVTHYYVHSNSRQDVNRSTFIVTCYVRSTVLRAVTRTSSATNQYTDLIKTLKSQMLYPFRNLLEATTSFITTAKRNSLKNTVL